MKSTREQLIKRNEELVKQCDKLFDQLTQGAWNYKGKSYGGVPLTNEQQIVIRDVLDAKLAEQHEYQEGEELYRVVEDDNETLAGIRLYVVKYSYSREFCTHILQYWKAVQL